MTVTMLDILRGLAEQVSTDTERLLTEFSGLRCHEMSGVINVSGNYYWEELPPSGKQLQARLIPKIARFGELIHVLAKDLPEAVQQELDYSLEGMRKPVEQQGATWSKTTPEETEAFRNQIHSVMSTLEGYYENSPADVLVIPDTNALLQNTDIEHWHFDNVDHFTVVLAPTVLAELDKHKMSHHNEQVREKASTLIRRLKEYRRRGSLHEGVNVVKDRISLRSIAAEPDMSKTLSWFDPANNDDRFLATALEIIRSNLGSAVLVVTSDINMQNKAELAAIPYCEVPERTAGKEEA